MRVCDEPVDRQAPTIRIKSRGRLGGEHREVAAHVVLPRGQGMTAIGSALADESARWARHLVIVPDGSSRR